MRNTIEKDASIWGCADERVLGLDALGIRGIGLAQMRIHDVLH